MSDDKGEYEVTVKPNGNWSVWYSNPNSTMMLIGSGCANHPDAHKRLEKGEKEAREFVKQHREQRQADRDEAKLTRRFIIEE